MKKLYLTIAAVVISACLSFAQSFGPYSIVTQLSKDDCMDRIDEWVALNLGSYSLNVDYRNEKTGRTIIKGVYVPSENKCYSVYKNALRASIEYVIVTQAKDNECIITFNSLNYCFKNGGYVDYDGIATRNLDMMVDEMEFIEELGEKIDITPELMDKASAYLEEYNSTHDQLTNPELKKSERKKINKAIDKMQGKRNVYYDVSMNTALFLKALVTSFEKALK